MPEMLPVSALHLPPQPTRRRLIRATFWTGLVISAAGTIAALGRFLGSAAAAESDRFHLHLAADQLPHPGDAPRYVAAGKCYLVNLRPGEAEFHGRKPDQQAGLVALYQACTHLGCRLPWRPDFQFEGQSGWFRCPCHGATYTKSGLCVFGPAPRNMDTRDLAQHRDGSATLDIRAINHGKQRHGI